MRATVPSKGRPASRQIQGIQIFKLHTLSFEMFKGVIKRQFSA